MNEAELALRASIFSAFAATGEPPEVAHSPELRALVERHVVVLGEGGSIVMAHPFASPGSAAVVRSGARTWWGSCAWDGLGIVYALGLEEATVTSTGVTVELRGGEPAGEALFHVAVPARQWWDDIAYT